MKASIVLAGTILAGGFLALIAAFQSLDAYHRDFFDPGALIFGYNVLRVVFLLYFVGIVVAIGSFVLRCFRAAAGIATMSVAERVVCTFGTGIGATHVIMLLLGVSGLYFKPLAIALCVVVLLLSAPDVATIWQRIRQNGIPRLSSWTIATITALFTGAAWLLIVKGLYPGGGGDYYTHYFYYYLEVLRNHGLQPNDVWYHYYYSKGAGPTFLAMLLADPEAPELVTYACVVMTAVGIATLASRLAPKTLWPAFAAVVYLVAYVVPLTTAEGGEFQKPHEEMSGLIVLAAWALCMRRIGPLEWSLPAVVMTASVLAASATLELAGSVLFGIFLGICAVWALIRRRTSDVKVYAALTGVAIVFTASILFLNYAVTGLATDQALNFMLRFANLERLNQWGVIPQIIIVAWVRHNYDLVASHFGLGTFIELRDYLRLGDLWVPIASAVAAVIILWLEAPLRRRWTGPRTPPTATDSAVTFCLLFAAGSAGWEATHTLVDLPSATTIARTILAGFLAAFAGVAFRLLRGQVRLPAAARRYTIAKIPLSVIALLGALIVTLGAISVPAAGSQTVSYLRFSGFFVPLILLFVVAIWGALLNTEFAGRNRQLVVAGAPIVVFALLLGSWQIATGWAVRAALATENGARFATGAYSLADAYHHQSSGLAYGGIEPGALAATQTLPPGTRVWSTNVDAYCMAPGCVMESAVSFKMSSRMNEILNDKPETARAILQSEGLDYFFFSKNAANGIIDLLPYSRLFRPETIAEYFGVRWTNGNDYLLTWKGPTTKPLGPSFRVYYRTALSGPEHPWFRFRELLRTMNATMTQLDQTPHPWHVLHFAWMADKNLAQSSAKM